MEISSRNYWEKLPDIVEAMAAATYISVDIEMTGIRTKNGASSEKTLEAMYQQAKEAAERFQIVQFGMTCVWYSASRKDYGARTFNFLLTPSVAGDRAVDKRLTQIVDRYVGLSQSSVMFLQDHDFQIDKAFKDGVSYLSHREIKDLGSKFLQPSHKTTGQLDLKDLDQKALEFYHSVRRTIRDWYTANPRQVDIANTGSGCLNSLQMRIITEMVERDYPACKTFPVNDRTSMRVKSKNEARDKIVAAQTLTERQGAIRRHTGFTFIIEALAGIGFTENLPYEYLVPGNIGNHTSAIAQLSRKLKRFNQQLIEHQPVLIGHNCLYDLCFMYQSFIGPLPPTIERFGSEIHKLFPRIVDTKFLTHPHGNMHSMIPDENLAELFSRAEKMSMPVVIRDKFLPGVVRSRGTAIAAHQAGFDSWMTAVVFLKFALHLSMNAPISELSLGGSKPAADNQEAYMSQLYKDVTNMNLSFSDETWKKHEKFEQEAKRSMLQSGSNLEVAPLMGKFPAPPKGFQPAARITPAAATYVSAKSGKSPSNVSVKSSTSSRSNNPPSLLDTYDAGVPGWEPLVPEGAPSPLPRLDACWNQAVLQQGPFTSEYRSIVTVRLPGWESKFWRAYGNKIPVGTSGVLDLDKC